VIHGDSGVPSSGRRDDVDEIAKLCEDLAAAGFIEPMTRHWGAEAGTDASCGSPQRAGKDPCGFQVRDEGPTDWLTGEEGYKAPW